MTTKKSNSAKSKSSNSTKSPKSAETKSPSSAKSKSSTPIDSRTLDSAKLRTSLKRHAKALNIPPGAAEIFIDKTIDSVTKSLKSKSLITEQDLTRVVTKELQKYHQDFAYVYKNHDKII